MKNKKQPEIILAAIPNYLGGIAASATMAFFAWLFNLGFWPAFFSILLIIWVVYTGYLVYYWRNKASSSLKATSPDLPHSQSNDYTPSPPDPSPDKYYSCFISHATKDRDFVDKLHTDLQSNGVKCWYAPKDLKIGDRFRQRFEESITEYDKLLLVLSVNSINSRWVETEVEAAFEKERRNNTAVLIPIQLDDTAMETIKAWAADIRRILQIGDFRNWQDSSEYQQSLEQLLTALRIEETS